MTPVLATIVALTNLMGTVEIDTRGARVTSYVPVGGSEVFFASETGTGGMPLCWPWFAGRGPAGSKRHGLVRDRVFKVVGNKRHASWDREVTLRLESDEETRKVFPHDFALTVSVRLNDRLTVTMVGENTGTDPFEVSEAFHPYFAVADSAQCQVDGTDTSEYRLTDPVTGCGLSFTDEGGADRRVWRPNAKSHLSKSVTPLAANDWRHFICVENGTLTSPSYVLKPGEKHMLKRTIRLSLTHANAKPIDLQSQIDAAAASGGGRVVVPPGEWLSKKAVQLRSNVELHLADGATLTFPDDPEACLPPVRTSFSAIEYYGLSPLVRAYGATNVAVTGRGTIAPRMALWREWFNRDRPDAFEGMRQLYEWGENDTPVEERRFKDLLAARLRPCCVEFERCRNVRLEDFRIRESPLWCIHLRLCEDVTVRGVDIRARGHNNDGIDINASRNVLIENCTLDQGDDGFVIKSGRDRDGRRVGVPCENVEIRNCVIRDGHTLIGVGSEVAGGVRNISLHDCRVEGPLKSSVAKIKTSDRKGAYVENIVVSNVVVSGTVGEIAGIYTDVDYQWGKYPPRERLLTRIDGFLVENVTAQAAKRVYHIRGDARLPAKNVRLKNIHVKSSAKPSTAENAELSVVPMAVRNGH